MPGVLQLDHDYIGCDELHLWAENCRARFFAGDRQHWHRQFRLSQLGEVPGGVWPGGKIGPSSAHTSWTGIGCNVGFAVCHRKRPRFVRREVVPEVREIDLLPSCDQSFWRRTVKAEVPKIGIVISKFPARDARKEGIHNDKLLDFGRA